MQTNNESMMPLDTQININKSKQSCPTCGTSQYSPYLTAVDDRLNVTDQKFNYVRCVDCGLVSLSPKPTFEETSSFYPKTFWRTGDTDAPQSVFQRFESWYRNHLIAADFRRLRRFFKPGARHLDVGCATGDLMAQCRALGAQCSGIELSVEAALHCKVARGLDVTAGDLVTHNFESKKFDVITYNGVLEHLSEPFAHLLKCRELLSPTGKVLIMGLPNLKSAGFRIRRKKWIGLDCPRHIHQFTAASLTKMLEAAGYQVEKIDYRSPRFNPPSLIASVFPSMHRHAFDRYQGRTGKNPIIRKAALLVLFELIRPIDFVLTQLGLGEHITCIASVRR